MTGRLVAVVGPSGVGKDSLMAGLLAADPSLSAVQRVVTRDPDAGGEPAICVTEAEFDAQKAAGAFALEWQAHGLSYGIPWTQLAPMKSGRDVLANLSRGMLVEAARVTGALHVLWITARPEVLAERLAQRGRESATEIAARIARTAPEPPEDLPVSVIDNSGALDDAIAAAQAALQPARV